MKDLIEEYRKLQKESEEDHKEWLCEHEKQNSLDKEMFLKLIEANIPISNFWTNGYVYEFHYNGRIVSFVNQETRICCTVHKVPESKDESDLLRDLWTYKGNGGFYEKIIEAFEYSTFIIEGSFKRSIKKLIERIKKGK